MSSLSDENSPIVIRTEAKINIDKSPSEYSKIFLIDKVKNLSCPKNSYVYSNVYILSLRNYPI